MDFGVMFFASAGGSNRESFCLLQEAVAFADRNGFTFVSTPERHFNEFGGLFPNPAVTCAGLATISENLQLRAGSLISPLHDTVRIAEEWSVVDNLSDGRAAISFGSGWNADDFIFYPERYAERHATMYEQIETVRQLWRGGEIERRNSFDKAVPIRLFPRPVQAELPIWITSSGNIETFASAGRYGANVLTHLIGQDLPTLAEKIVRYRAAGAEAADGEFAGRVTLMLHTYLGDDTETARSEVRAPFREYLRSAIRLEQLAAEAGGAISGGYKIDPQEISPTDLEDLLDVTFERYAREGSLIGTPESCEPLVDRLCEIGVDEIACLIDFIDDRAAILRSLPHVAELARRFSASEPVAVGSVIDSFMEDLEG